MSKIKIAEDFSKYPGPRLSKVGKNSGEELRENVLLGKIQDAISKNEVLIVDLDGVFGYAASFLDEAFGGLVFKNNIRIEDLQKHMVIVSSENPDYIDEIWEYILEKAE